MSRIEITTDEFGVGTIRVDGHNLSEAVGYPVVIERGLVTIALPDAVLSAKGEGRVAMDEPTVEALRVLGWTPPAEGGE